MKALRLPEPGRAEIVDIAEPAAPQGEQVLLRVRFIGFCGTDLNTFRGKNPLVSYPRIPGHEISATVVACGPEASAELQPGMDVTVSPYSNCGRCSACRQNRPNCCRYNETLGVQRDGALTEYFLAPSARVIAAPGLARRELALVEPLAVGFHGVSRGRVAASDTVLVFGCGAVGLGAVAGAARRGARVIAADLDAEKLQTAREAGASVTIDASREPVHERIRALTDGHGPEVVIEAVGTPQTFRAAVEEVGFAGRVVYIGYAKEPVTYETKLFVQKELDILGARNSLASFPDVIATLREGRFPVERTITRVTSLADSGEALAEWSSAPGMITRILVEVAG